MTRAAEIYTLSLRDPLPVETGLLQLPTKKRVQKRSTKHEFKRRAKRPKRKFAVMVVMTRKLPRLVLRLRKLPKRSSSKRKRRQSTKRRKTHANH